MLIRKGGITREIRSDRFAGFARKGYAEVVQAASAVPVKPEKPAAHKARKEKTDGR